MVLGVGKGVLFREVSSVQRLARVVLGVGKGVLFREVSSVQRLARVVLGVGKGVSSEVGKSGTWGGKRCPV